jgi:membrane-associated phospholipid phosphatase
MTSKATAAILILTLLAPVESCDRRLQLDVQTLRRPGLERPMHTLSEGCNRTTVAIGLLAVALLGGPAGVETARVAVVVLVPVNLAVEGVKRVVNRARPDGEQKRSNASFPSSHAANAFALAVILSRRWRRLTPLFVVLALAVGFARLYLNRHYPSDVIVGALLGSLLAWLAARAWERRRRGAGLEPHPEG